MTWTQTTAGTPDARWWLWTSSWTDANNVSRYAEYQVFEDPASPNTSLPTLPAAYSDDDPMAHAGMVGAAMVMYLDYDNLAGYEAARPYGPGLFRPGRFSDVEHRVRITTRGTSTF